MNNAIDTMPANEPTAIIDLGNNEVISCGVLPQADGTWLAMTYSRSRYFKTQRGAVMWFRAACPGVDPFRAYRVQSGR